MRLVKTPEAHLPILMRWFATERQCREWGGPRFRFPFDADTFRADTRFGEMPSYSLVGGDDTDMRGFGQYYPRRNRCHFARLAIAPEYRGHRLGEVLVRQLAQTGCDELGVRECSLFVLIDNAPAVALYRRLGFEPAPYPDDDPFLAECHYMVWATPTVIE
jgi:ribosomal protein S18 acetylase RimI-like enzyme